MSEHLLTRTLEELNKLAQRRKALILEMQRTHERRGLTEAEQVCLRQAIRRWAELASVLSARAVCEHAIRVAKLMARATK